MKLKREKYKNKKKYYKPNKGSDLRQKLVNLYKYKKIKDYDNLTDKIINDYRDGDMCIFIHLNNKFYTFSDITKICLNRFLIRAQEEAIQESMVYLNEIMLLDRKNIIRPQKYYLHTIVK